MWMAAAVLTVLSRIPFGFSIFQTCIPNKQFQWNDRVCHCDSNGHWSEANCHTAGRRQACLPGQIVWENCSQCICKENGQLSCTYIGCNEELASSKVVQRDYYEAAGVWCTPFRFYYINCNLCVCPASGKTSEFRCAADPSCSSQDSPSPLNFSVSTTKNVCIPKVMYLFPCLHCVCSDDGFFVMDKCVETCHKTSSGVRRCIPRTFYRKECNVCWCPDNSTPNKDLCTNSACHRKTKLKTLDHLRNKMSSCLSHTFTKPKCFYCNCNFEGKANENACLALNCLTIDDFKYDFENPTCSPGEMVPICMQCFCPRNEIIDIKYCTKICSFQSKLNVLEKVIHHNIRDDRLINPNFIKKITVKDICKPNSLYMHQGRYCLCPDNENTNFKLCTSVTESPQTFRSQNAYIINTINIDFNTTCEPNTFVEFDCNTCYCGKNGKIDPKWCTYDDCVSKNVIQEGHKTHRTPINSIVTPNPRDACNPGAISKVKCNYCICPDNGLVKDLACTKNRCAGIDDTLQEDMLVCEPLAYYIVDCNICFCPKDGIKNLAKCTKNQCEKNFLRSDTCVAGDLFSDNCNVCVCPPNGDKSDKACTNHTCSDTDTPWQKIYKISKNLLGSKSAQESTRNLDLCFPGEEFADGCKICVCPDMGLREFAMCTPTVCADGPQKNDLNHQNYEFDSTQTNKRSRRDEPSCQTYNLTDSSERQECTPGSVYIIRCRECICPYMGSVNSFCRHLPLGTYCEQAFPNFNYLPMGRRNVEANKTMINSTLSPEQITHNHTRYRCDPPGKILDLCYVCECEDHVIIEEHCFKSNATNCLDARPSFLSSENKIN